MLSSVYRLSSVFSTREAGDWCSAGDWVADRTCQKLVSSELYVSQASAAGIRSWWVETSLLRISRAT